jgi:uncharacterized membrane-anchored protein
MTANATDNKLLSKVANVTILFWVIKIISTTVGEASADFFGHQFGPIAAVLTFIVLAIAIVIQIKFKRYVPWMYWAVIILIAVFGTMFADITQHLAGISLMTSSLGFLGLLAIVFAIWYKNEKTLDVHTIYTTKREIFYWVVIFFTFAFGTAAGDLVADSFHFGYLDATLIFGAAMIIIPLALYLLKINMIALFWISYILTRPFGAAGADLIGKPISRGGFGLGDGTTALIFLAIIVALIIWLSMTHRREMLIEERL